MVGRIGKLSGRTGYPVGPWMSPHKIMGFYDIRASKPYEFMGFRATIISSLISCSIRKAGSGNLPEGLASLWHLVWFCKSGGVLLMSLPETSKGLPDAAKESPSGWPPSSLEPKQPNVVEP
jgi:hypothetical protein